MQPAEKNCGSGAGLCCCIALLCCMLMSNDVSQPKALHPDRAPPRHGHPRINLHGNQPAPINQ